MFTFLYVVCEGMHMYVGVCRGLQLTSGVFCDCALLYLLRQRLLLELVNSDWSS